MNRYSRKKKSRRTRFWPLLLLLGIAMIATGAWLLHREGYLFPAQDPPSVVTTDTTDVTDTDTQTDVTTDTDDPPAPLPPKPDTDPAAEISFAADTFADLTFTAKHLMVYDLTADAVLFEKDTASSITAASTTKLLTALTMLDHVVPETRFTVGSELSLVGKGSSTAKLKKGMVFTTEQILDAMLLPSGNDAAYVIAVQVGRMVAEDPEITDKEGLAIFLQLMNEKAAALGAGSSLFTCPDGYPGGSQHTTVQDMMKIAIAAMKNEAIANSCRKTFAEYTLPDGRKISFTSTNQLILPSSQFYYEGAVGLKTGYTEKAGQCIVGAARLNGHTVIAAVYNAPDPDARWKDCRKAFNAAFDAVEKAQAAYAQRPAA